ncbi:hypothetical protein AWC38_SpisGene24423 [Stylophora pistillata]|uniref:Uncharacterized protein n=1 Tax=Stylophora pistillata TaxID=50429 RepID=A0A2B4R686_STYPI|nr:hypothetical protein AWC38_SpisGene24423 [Stylophora pistillata]
MKYPSLSPRSAATEDETLVFPTKTALEEGTIDVADTSCDEDESVVLDPTTEALPFSADGNDEGKALVETFEVVAATVGDRLIDVEDTACNCEKFPLLDIITEPEASAAVSIAVTETVADRLIDVEDTACNCEKFPLLDIITEPEASAAVLIDVTETVADGLTAVDNPISDSLEFTLVDVTTEPEVLAGLCLADTVETVADVSCDWVAFMLAELAECDPVVTVAVELAGVICVVTALTLSPLILKEEDCELVPFELS